MEVKVPPESEKLPLMLMLESPPVKVPEDWLKSVVMVIVMPVCCVIVPE